MSAIVNLKKNQILHLHLTNVTALGATRLLESLLPAMQKLNQFQIGNVFISEHSSFSEKNFINIYGRVKIYRRYFPNVISRFFECVIKNKYYGSQDYVLVFGDIPINCSAHQTVFVQQSMLIPPKKIIFSFEAFKFMVARFIFRRNLKYVDALIVQTQVMKGELAICYPASIGKTYIISQPPPQWFIDDKPFKRDRYKNQEIKLFYPAAFYSHKNHCLLKKISFSRHLVWPVTQLLLTIQENDNPAHEVSWIECLGLLPPLDVVKVYKEVDALLFLSYEESYGLPLIEAMSMGLPIIAPNLPYATNLCGPQAIYFNPESIQSLNRAVHELKDRLDKGWAPDWGMQLQKLSKDWNEVAEKMFTTAFLTTAD